MSAHAAETDKAMLEATEGSIEVRTPYFIRKLAPVSKVETWGEGAAFGPTAKRTGTDAGAFPHPDIAQNDGAGADQHAIGNLGMAIFLGLAGAAQRHVL